MTRWPFFALLLWLCSSSVHASPLFELVGGFGGTGLLQARSEGPSAASAYFNPALLADAEPGLSAGVLVINTEIGVVVGARQPTDAVPDGLVNAIHADGSRLAAYPIATELLQYGRAASGYTPALAPRPRQLAGSGHQTYSYEALGVVLALLDGRFRLGFYGLIPNRSLTRLSSFYVDEREQYFSNSLHPELYGDRLTALSLAFAGGLRITDRLALGLGAAVMVDATAKAPAYVADAGALQDIQLNTDARAKVSLIPHAGLSWRPLERLHLTGTVHAPQKLDIDASFSFLLATGVQQASSLAFTYDFQPWLVGAGSSYDLVKNRDRSLAVTMSILYARWSKYIDRQAARPEGAYRWQDTLSGAAGVRFRDRKLAVSLDGQYQPTPVPLQTGRTNYVDNNRLGLALALEYSFVFWKLRGALGAQLQCYRLIARYQRKLRPPSDPLGRDVTPQLVRDEVPDDAVVSSRAVEGRDGLQTNNPGWPGFSSAGWVSSAGVYLKVSL